MCEERGRQQKLKAGILVRRVLHKSTVAVGENRGGVDSEQGQVRASPLSGAGDGEPGVEALSGQIVEEEAGGVSCGHHNYLAWL